MQYTVQAAARATGVSEHRIRTWERRHGVPAPARSPKGRRLYNDDDLRVIRVMARLIDSGIPADEAARAAVSSGRIELPAADESAAQPAASPIVETLLDAVRAFDGQRLEQQLRRAFAESSNEEAIDGVVMPLLHEVGEGWARAEIGVACEHFTSEIVRRILVSRVDERRPVSPGAPVLVLGCAVGEHHDLGMLALWLLLLDWDLNLVVLGADVPEAEMVAACKAVDADAACLVATTATAVSSMWLIARRLARLQRPRHVFVGGPGLDRQTESGIRAGEILPPSIPDAARAIAASLGARYRGIIETTPSPDLPAHEFE